MDEVRAEVDLAMMVDANAAAGLLDEVFGVEMTVSPTICAHCGRSGQIGTLLAFVRSPGVVLRCPSCRGVVLRIVEAPDAFYVDARGAVYLRLTRES